ncbi:MAG: hypothetical protein KA586_08865 [Candidatus Promineofilum sp.]|nr:hypothetical protein [Promineifilum sp.]
MRRTITIVIFATAMLLAGCRGRTALDPTPFPTVGPAVTQPGAGPVVLTVTELMSAPGLYRDAIIQVTGLLRKQPLVVCDSDYHPSPAAWGLAEEGVLALAGGFGPQVRSLLPDQLTMTVEGRWRRWQGLVGCGKQAVDQEVWYLETSRILSPSPITQVTLTPASGVEIVEVTPVPELAPTLEGETVPTPILEETPIILEPTTGPVAQASPTTDLSGLNPTLTPTLPVNGTLPSGTVTGLTPPAGLTGTPTASPTGTPGGTPAPTVSGTPPSPTPTGTTASTGQVISKGNLIEVMYDELGTDFAISSLAGGVTDSWELDIFEDESLYVYVVAPSPADIILSVLKDGQSVVNRQNTAPAGAPEFINNPTLLGEGLYEIQVLTVNGASTDYAITFYTDPESAIVFPGIIVSGSPRSAVQMSEGAYHYWFFVGSAGDDITATLTPLGDEDVALYLFDPNNEEMVLADDGFEGEEEIIEATLELSGLHALEVEEYDNTSLSYNLELTIE